MKKGKLMMIDGLDGSGKGVAVDALKEFAISSGKRIIDLKEYWKSREGFPEISGYDIIFSAEPTYTGIGKRIRESLIKNSSSATPKEIAEAYSEDRKELYTKVVIPALEHGKIVVSDRGVVTSLVYQAAMENGCSLQEISAMEGNALCLKHRPDILVIMTLNPETEIERLGSREKKDDVIFENLEFQQKIKKRYESAWLRNLFESKGTKVICIDTSAPSTVEDTKRKIIEIFKKYVLMQP